MRYVRTLFSLGGLTSLRLSSIYEWERERKKERKLTRWQVGNEFSSVEALWSQFENVMAKEPEEDRPETEGEGEVEGEEGEEEEGGDQSKNESP